ncbi:unnamed protein product [marine sediment metagenome]|uniref:Nuclease associated modular domain-containing protein n=1 Tax=marine sediment metagenome TaxID=412755 RepID=X1LEW0_9ZZZZ
MTSLVYKEIRGGVGVLKLERVQVICPACGQQVEAVAGDGRVKGYCSVARQHVDFLIETQLAPQSVVRIGNLVTAETRAKLSASAKKLWQDPEYRARQIATFTGRHPSPETKAKISAAMTRWHNRKGNRG